MSTSDFVGAAPYDCPYDCHEADKASAGRLARLIARVFISSSCMSTTLKGDLALERPTPSTTAPNTPSSSVPTTPVSMVPAGMAQASCRTAIKYVLHWKYEMYVTLGFSCEC